MCCILVRGMRSSPGLELADMCPKSGLKFALMKVMENSGLKEEFIKVCKTFSIDQRRTCGINKRTVQPVLTDEDLAYITNAGSRWPIEILNLPGRQRQLRDRRRSQCQSGFCYLPTTTPHYIPPASILPPTPSQFGHTYQLRKWPEMTVELTFGWTR